MKSSPVLKDCYYAESRELVNRLTCKAAASSILGWPLIRLDIGSLKGSLVGESERKMREATRVIDAFGEAVYLDR